MHRTRALLLPLAAVPFLAPRLSAQQPVAAKAPDVRHVPASTTPTPDSARLGAQSTVSAGAQRTLRARRIAGSPPTIDGRLDDAAWAGAEVATDFVQQRPRAGARATARTEVRVLYDGAAIYIGARMYDAAPDSVIARLGRRDEGVYSDLFTVMLDSYHDRRTAFSFSVNPRGVKRDALLYDDTRADGSWDAVWDAEARVDSLGWTAEFRIPLSQLRYSRPESDTSATTWGVNFRRYVARRDEVSDWSYIPREAGRLVSLFGQLDSLRDLGPSRGLELWPYAVARLTREPGDARNPFYKSTAMGQSAGLDLRYGLRSDMTLSATVNPDFGQVEADPSVINLTAYEVRFPERRPFFVERSDLFRFGVGDAQLFYSRRIGRPPERGLSEPNGFVDVPSTSTILGAAKLTGRTADGLSYGVLQAVTAAENARVVDSTGRMRDEPVEPATSYTIARVAKDFSGGKSALSAMFTGTARELGDSAHRLDFLRSAAYSGGISARHRFAEQVELSGALLGTSIQGSTRAISLAQLSSARYFQRPDAHYVHFDSTRRNLAGYAAQVAVQRVGSGNLTWGGGASAISPGFEPNDAGFLRQADAISQYTYVTYGRYEPTKTLRSWSATVSQYAGWDFGGDPFGGGAGASVSAELPSFWGGSLSAATSTRGIATGLLRGGPAVLVPGNTSFNLSLYSDTRQSVSYGVYASAARDHGTVGASRSVGGYATVRPSMTSDLSFGPTLSWYRDPTQFMGEQKGASGPYWLVAQVDQASAGLTARANVAVTRDLSIQAYAEPFIGAAAYSRPKTIVRFRAPSFDDRVRALSEAEVAELGLAVGESNFNYGAFNSTLVARWEYRRGSTLFVAWTHGQYDGGTDGSLRLGRDLGNLFGRARATAENVVMVKVNWWVGM